MDFTSIEQKRARLRPLPEYTLESWREHLMLTWIYNSNAIEGNSLSLTETKVVLEGITVGGKTIHEHLEVINHRDAIEYLEGLVRDHEPLDEWEIRNLHRLILKGIDDKNAGAYRTQNVLISGARHRPPDHLKVPELMAQLVSQLNGDWQQLHPVERAALLHTIFVKVHPFVDGNGRTARLLLNLELMQGGYPPIIIRAADRMRYYRALDKGHTTDDHRNFIQLVAEGVEESLDLWLSLL